jgi:hypothetical protein
MNLHARQQKFLRERAEQIQYLTDRAKQVQALNRKLQFDRERSDKIVRKAAESADK